MRIHFLLLTLIYHNHIELSVCFRLCSNCIFRPSHDTCLANNARRMHRNSPSFRMSVKHQLLVYNFESSVNYVDALEIQKQFQAERIQSKVSKQLEVLISNVESTDKRTERSSLAGGSRVTRCVDAGRASESIYIGIKLVSRRDLLSLSTGEGIRLCCRHDARIIVAELVNSSRRSNF
jgi:hypothetical protein